MLEQSLNEFGGSAQPKQVRRKKLADIINQGYDSEGNEIENQGSFEEDNQYGEEMDDQVLRD